MWSITAARTIDTCRRTATLQVKTKRQLLKYLRDMPEADAANVFFPECGLFGCEFMLGHVLSKSIQPKGASPEGADSGNED